MYAMCNKYYMLTTSSVRYLGKIAVQDALGFAIQLLSSIGTNLFQNDWRSKIISVLPLIAAGLNVPLIITRMVFAGGNIFIWVEQFETLTLYYQVTRFVNK